MAGTVYLKNWYAYSSFFNAEIIVLVLKSRVFRKVRTAFFYKYLHKNTCDYIKLQLIDSERFTCLIFNFSLILMNI
jgi:hypothetical protein